MVKTREGREDTRRQKVITNQLKCYIYSFLLCSYQVSYYVLSMLSMKVKPLIYID